MTAASTRSARPLDFLPVTSAERELERIEAAPWAPAVILFKRGELWMQDASRGRPSSRLHVQVRIKILSDEGRRLYGQVDIGHPRFTHLRRFEGRTVSPHGEMTPLASESVLERINETGDRISSAVFPDVVVGSILDYRYDLELASPFSFEPWFFDGELHTLRSEIRYIYPEVVTATDWHRISPGYEIAIERTHGRDGNVVHARMSDLPPQRAEPYSPPLEERANQFLLLPRRLGSGPRSRALFSDWEALVRLALSAYDATGRLEKGVEKRLLEEVLRDTTDPRQRTVALFEYVRDRFETVPARGVWVEPDSRLSRVVHQRRGTSVEKAILLRELLEAAGIEARLAWLASRQPELPNPDWFRSILVLARLDGETVRLDTVAATPFGHLSPRAEGSTMLILDPERPELIPLERCPPHRNRRRVRLDLALGPKGTLGGRGELLLTGHRASERLAWKPTAAERATAWRDWLARSFDDFEVSAVTVRESVTEAEVELTWQLDLRSGLILDGELTLLPARPHLPSVETRELGRDRQTPFRLPFAWQDEIELRLIWSTGWELALVPGSFDLDSVVGSLRSHVEHRADSSALVYRRHFEVSSTEVSGADYRTLRALIRQHERESLQDLVLVRTGLLEGAPAPVRVRGQRVGESMR